MKNTFSKSGSNFYFNEKNILLFIIYFTFKSLTWIPFKYLQISLCCFPVYTFVGDFVPHFHTSAEVSFNTGVTQKRSISRFSQKISRISENISNGSRSYYQTRIFGEFTHPLGKISNIWKYLKTLEESLKI